MIKKLLKNAKKHYIEYNEVRVQVAEVKSILNSFNSVRLQAEDITEIKAFYAKYTNFNIKPYWHKLYINAGQNFDVRFIPVDFLFTRVIPKLNNKKFIEAYADKNQYELFLPEVKHPRTILKRIMGDFYCDGKIIKKEDALSIISKLNDVIVKPTINTQQGAGVFIFNSEAYSKSDIETLFTESVGNNYIIQEKVVAHPVVSSLNPSSLNTVRMITYRDGNNVKILSATLKIGKPGELVDNGHAGGTFCGITEDGKLRQYAYSLSPFTKSEKTYNGIAIKGMQLPNYNKLTDKVCELALKLPYTRYVGWDMAIDEKGDPVLIELNLRCPGGNIMQIPNGPLFGEYTEEVLAKLKYGKSL